MTTTRQQQVGQLLARLLLLQSAATSLWGQRALGAYAPEQQPGSLISDADYAGPNGGGGGGPGGSPAADECDPDMVGFELVSGYVYTAPKNLIESIPGSLMLTECLETCQANDSCQAVNYETGLCVLFSSNADSNPGKPAGLLLSRGGRRSRLTGRPDISPGISTLGP